MVSYSSSYSHHPKKIPLAQFLIPHLKEDFLLPLINIIWKTLYSLGVPDTCLIDLKAEMTMKSPVFKNIPTVLLSVLLHCKQIFLLPREIWLIILSNVQTSLEESLFHLGLLQQPLGQSCNLPMILAGIKTQQTSTGKSIHIKK